MLIDVPTTFSGAQVEEFIYPEKAGNYRLQASLRRDIVCRLKKAAKLLESAKRPVICCGGGVVSAGARDEMIAFAKKTGIPVVATMMGLGLFLWTTTTILV